MTPAQLSEEDASGGMNSFDPPYKIGRTQVARMVNCSLVEGLPTTRMGCRVVPITGEGSEFISKAPFQGSIFYNPAKGQGGILLADSNASFAAVFGGRKFIFSIGGRRSSAKGTVHDITGGLVSSAQNHLAWLHQWEDLLIVADGEGKTFIYQPTTGAVLSRGYNTLDKSSSEIPNGATVLSYAHGRGVAVVNSRQILVGDSLHRLDFTTSSNLREFTEQAYWATGQYFLPPSAMGGINAAAILPLKNTQHGHGDLVFHCEDGIFSIDLNQYPRSSWAELPLVKHAVLQSGATGPYAITLFDGDQIYRTRAGAQSLRSAAALETSQGAPEQNLSAEVETWFGGDYPRWLRFASVCAWSAARKLFFTTAPIVRGSYRWHRGIVVRNTNVFVSITIARGAWEGLWTLPPESAGVIQLVTGIFDGDERFFAWTRGNDETTRLVEFSSAFRSDILADGTRRPIRSQVMTRAIDAGEWWKEREFIAARLFLRCLEGLVKWGVWFRTESSPGWKPLQSGSVEVLESEDTADLSAPLQRSISIHLGQLPDSCQPDSMGKANESRSIQFLVRWEGYCSFEGVKVENSATDLSDTGFDKSRFQVKFSKSSSAPYEDFEYSLTDANLWHPE